MILSKHNLLYVAFSGQAVACFLIWSPGLLMTDSVARWAGAYAIIGKVDIPWATTNYLSHAMTLPMIAIAKFGLPTWTFVAAQITFFYYAVYRWADLSHGALRIVLVFFVPSIFLYSAYVVPDTWVTAALILCAIILNESARQVSIVKVFLLSFVLFGFRLNTIVILPVFLIQASFIRNSSMSFRLIMMVSIVAGAATASILPRLVGFHGPTSSAASAAWELVGALRIAKERGIELDRQYDLSPAGNIDSAILKHSFATVEPLIWGENAPLPAGNILPNNSLLWSKYFEFFAHYPLLALESKARIWICLLGVCQPLSEGFISFLEPSLVVPELKHLVEFKNNDASIASLIMSWHNRLFASFPWLFAPISWLSISIGIFVIRIRSYLTIDKVIFCYALLYYVSQFLITQAASFRYNFPSLFVALIIMILGSRKVLQKK